MYFTDYFCIEDINTSDILGLQAHTSKLIDILLPQFTSNTQTPAYFGLLCAIYLLKQKLDIPQKDFNKFARTIEFIWGIICIESNKIDRVINKIKFIATYENLNKKNISLKQIEINKLLHSKYSYGVIGHYKKPAQKWGLLNSDESLTLLGEELATSWNERKTRNSFISLIKTIYANKDINISQLKNYSQYTLSALPSNKEKEFWKERINNITITNPLAKELWEKLKFKPNNEQIFKYLKKNSQELKLMLTTYEWYEQATAIINFLFDYEYYRKHNNIPSQELPPLVKQAVSFLQTLLNKKTMIENLPSKPKILQIKVKNYEQVISDIIKIHIEHQRSKNRQAYFDENHNIVLAKNCNSIEIMSNEKISAPEQLINNYPVNFFFDKVITWNDYII